MPIKILVYFAVHKRLEVLKVCLKGIRRLQKYDKKRFDIQPFAVCSTEEESNVLLHFDIPHIIHENQPLGEKKNAGLRAAMTLEWDYLMELGSDDLLKSELLDLYYPMFKRGDLAWGLNSCYFFELGTNKVGIHENHYAIGAGRCFKRDIFAINQSMATIRMLKTCGNSKGSYGVNNLYRCSQRLANEFVKHKLAILEPIETKLEFWTPSRQRALDGDSMNRLKLAGVEIECIETTDPYILDIKSGVNINSIDIFPEIDFPILDHFKHEANAIRRLRPEN